MPRLKVNPNSPAAWEIELKPGTNSIGRGLHNDFKLEDPGVSGSHCQIVVNEGHVILRDLGSTNGTFVDRAPVREAVLQSGQTIHLGGVELLFECEPSANLTMVAGKPPVPATSPGRMRITARPTAVPVAVDHPISPPPLMAPPPIPPSPGTSIAVREAFCKFHPKTPARYFCSKCQKYFCEFCVVARATGSEAKKMCRSCGTECAPVQVPVASPVRGSFFFRVPGAFIYPFRGVGLLILVCATIAFAALGFISVGIFSIFAKIVFYGFLFLFMQNIILTTASDEKEPLCFPGAGGLFGAAFQLVGTIAASFGLAIGLLAARYYDVEIPVSAIIAAVLLGCLYFPMAFLAVAMKDTVLAANPLVVVPAILKIPFQYLVASILLMSVFGFRQLGSLLSGVAGAVSLSTHDISVFFIALGVQAAWAFLSVYLLTVNMRVLGLLYNANKEKLGWFSR
jgi:FHA domain-containing protein/B-box zinc finger protein